MGDSSSEWSGDAFIAEGAEDEPAFGFSAEVLDVDERKPLKSVAGAAGSAARIGADL
jgi:hypothetical protein